MGTLDPDATPRERLTSILQVPSLEKVHENVAGMWDMGQRFPVPKFRPTCPTCSGTDIILRYMRFFKRGGYATYPFRCDVHMKCSRCSLVWVYGVVIPKQMFLDNQKIGMIHRKQILEILEGMDGV